jgi:hypothetical protein
MFQFNARNVQPATGFEPWPEGWNPLVITKSNMRPVKDNANAGYLELQIEAIDGPNKGKSNFIRLNLQNPSQQAVDIAHRTLSAICHVIGVYDVQEMPGVDTCVPMLHNRPFLARCVVQKNKETGQEGNNFVAFKDMAGNEPGKVNAAPQQQPQQYQPAPQNWGAPQPQPQPYAAPGPNVPQPQPQGTVWPAPNTQPQPYAPPNPAPQPYQPAPNASASAPDKWTQNPNAAPPNAPWRTPGT